MHVNFVSMYASTSQRPPSSSWRLCHVGSAQKFFFIFYIYIYIYIYIYNTVYIVYIYIFILILILILQGVEFSDFWRISTKANQKSRRFFFSVPNWTKLKRYLRIVKVLFRSILNWFESQFSIGSTCCSLLPANMSSRHFAFCTEDEAENSQPWRFFQWKGNKKTLGGVTS